MTKQKRIQEMAKVLPDTLPDWYDKNRKIILGKSFKTQIAREYYNAGYRKVGEDTFVLTIEDLKKYAKDCLIGEIAGLDILNGAFAKAERVAEQVRKETAKEIYLFLKEHCDYAGFLIIETFLVERYGIELE